MYKPDVPEEFIPTENAIFKSSPLAIKMYEYYAEAEAVKKNQIPVIHCPKVLKEGQIKTK